MIHPSNKTTLLHLKGKYIVRRSTKKNKKMKVSEMQNEKCVIFKVNFLAKRKSKESFFCHFLGFPSVDFEDVVASIGIYRCCIYGCAENCIVGRFFQVVYWLQVLKINIQILTLIGSQIQLTICNYLDTKQAFNNKNKFFVSCFSIIVGFVDGQYINATIKKN